MSSHTHVCVCLKKKIASRKSHFPSFLQKEKWKQSFFFVAKEVDKDEAIVQEGETSALGYVN